MDKSTQTRRRARQRQVVVRVTVDGQTVEATIDGPLVALQEKGKTIGRRVTRRRPAVAQRAPSEALLAFLFGAGAMEAVS